MRYLIVFYCCLLSIFSQSVQAVELKIERDRVDNLYSELASAKLNKMQPILEQLAHHEGEKILPIFTLLLDGRLYYVKTDLRLVGKYKQQGNTHYQYVFPENETTTTKLTKRNVKKIRVNNKLRSYLRTAIARLQLTAHSPQVRQQAVRNLLAKLDENTVLLLETLYPTEKNKNVKDVMALALALHSAQQTEATISARVLAIETLATSLESHVRNVLVELKQDDNPAIVAAAQTALTQIQQRTNRFAFIDQLFFGLSLGSVLLLASIGLAITFGVMGVINMAHGEMIMLGAYTTYVVQLLLPNHLDYSLWVAIPAAFLVSGSMGVLLERLVIRHLHGRPLETLLATFGVSLILQQLVRSVFSPLNRQVSTPSWMSGSWEINPVLSLTLNRLYILAFALLVFLLLVMILKKTSLGLNVRAVAQNRAMAKAMGVKTHRVDAMTFGLGSGIAGIAGVALSQLTNVGPNLGQAYIIDSFMVVVFGGVGNLFGTLVAAFSLGIGTKFLEPITGTVLASIFVLVFIILFIQKRPKGLFPQKGRAAE